MLRCQLESIPKISNNNRNYDLGGRGKKEYPIVVQRLHTKYFQRDVKKNEEIA